MKRVKTLVVACCATSMLAATAWAQPPRQDAIWARSTAGAPIVLDGKLDEPAWALVESKVIDFQTDTGIPGGGWKPEGGFLPTDPTHATVKFLTVGNKLYMGVVLPDKSIGGSVNFNRFDGLLMSIKDHLSTNHPAPPTELFYVWWNTALGATDPQPTGQQPVFAGGGPFAAQPSYSPRTPAQIDGLDAVTVVRGITNTDAVEDTSWTVEMKFSLDALGYNITQPQGDIIEFNLSIYDCDAYWPLVPINLAANRVWWQGPWGNSPGYDEVRIYAKPSVTVNTNPLPFGPEVIVPNGSQFAPPGDRRLLNDAVWANAARRHPYGDAAQYVPASSSGAAVQFQPDVNGGQAAVSIGRRHGQEYASVTTRSTSASTCATRWCRRRAHRPHGRLRRGVYDRTARETFDNTLQPPAHVRRQPDRHRRTPTTSPRWWATAARA